MNKIAKTLGLAGIVLSMYAGCGKETPLTPEQEAERWINQIGGKEKLGPLLPQLSVNQDYKEPKKVKYMQIAMDNDGIMGYIWKFGDGTAKITPGIKGYNYDMQEHTYKEAGEYTAEVIVYDNRGNRNSTETKVNIE